MVENFIKYFGIAGYILLTAMYQDNGQKINLVCESDYVTTKLSVNEEKGLVGLSIFNHSNVTVITDTVNLIVVRATGRNDIPFVILSNDPDDIGYNVKINSGLVLQPSETVVVFRSYHVGDIPDFTGIHLYYGLVDSAKKSIPRNDLISNIFRRERLRGYNFDIDSLLK